MDAYVEKFRRRLNKAMKKQNMTAAELSRRTGIPAAVISQYRSGRYKPRQERINALADTLGVTPAWLMGLWEGGEKNGGKEKAVPCDGT